MAILPTDLEAITEDHILDLLGTTKEGELIDFKEAWPDKRNDKANDDFLGDVSAFANAAGGHIIYGIQERYEEGKTTGIAEEIIDQKINSDEEIRRLLQRLRSRVEPPLKIPIKPIKTQRGTVIVAYVPRSWQAPHRVRYAGKIGDATKFYTRGPGLNLEMSLGELRQAFSLSEALAAQAHELRNNRVADLRNGEGPVPLPLHEPKLYLYAFPLERRSTPIPLSALRGAAAAIQSRNWFYSEDRPRPNLDGLLLPNLGPHYEGHYVQLLRRGGLETCRLGLATSLDDGHAAIVGNLVARVAFEFMLCLPKVFTLLDTTSPVLCGLVLLNANGHKLKSAGSNFFFDRDFVLVPDLLLEDPQSQDSVLPLAQQLCDILWQAAGGEKCPFLVTTAS